MNNVEIIKNLYEAFAAGDMDTVLAVIEPNVVWVESEGIPYGGVFNGIDAVVEGVFNSLGTDWENFTANVDTYIDAGDKVITQGHDSGTYKATGKSMSAPTASIWTLEDGKVVRFEQYINTLNVVEATIN
ncbi:MAG: nuclear transport factor 2 family protein [Chloroflexota bacterium]